MKYQKNAKGEIFHEDDPETIIASVDAEIPLKSLAKTSIPRLDETVLSDVGDGETGGTVSAEASSKTVLKAKEKGQEKEK